MRNSDLIDFIVDELNEILVSSELFDPDIVKPILVSGKDFENVKFEDFIYKKLKEELDYYLFIIQQAVEEETKLLTLCPKLEGFSNFL